MIIYIAAGILAIGFLVLSYLTYLRIFHRPSKIYEEDTRMPAEEIPPAYQEAVLAKVKALQAHPWETITITSQDGLKLYGRYYHQRDGAPLHICFHSYHGTPLRDCCGFASYYLSLGHNLLLTESRGRFRSEGSCVTFGVKERHDCVAWTQACRQRFGEDTPIILSGLSMGATTVLMASSLGLSPSVKGIVADSGYSKPAYVLRRLAVHSSLPNLLAYPCLWTGALLFAHFSYEHRSAIRSVKKTKVPILVLHGSEDRLVPCTIGSQLQEANLQMVSFYSFPGAGHGMSYFSDPERYEQLLHLFLKNVLPQQSPTGKISGEEPEKDLQENP